MYQPSLIRMRPSQTQDRNQVSTKLLRVAKMSLPTGARLGPYEIEAPIGAGGMMKSTVDAIPDSVARRLSKPSPTPSRAVLASLNHSNIAVIYGFEQADGVPFRALEFVPVARPERTGDFGAASGSRREKSGQPSTQRGPGVYCQPLKTPIGNSG